MNIEKDRNGEKLSPTRIAFVITSKTPANKGMGRALGAGTLGAFLNKSMPGEIDMSFTDLQYTTDPLKTVADIIEQPDIDIVGISVRYDTYLQMKQILEMIEQSDLFKSDKHPYVVIGGVMPSFLAREIVQQHPVAGVVSGEGELAMKELTRIIREKGSLYDVPGLTFYDDDKSMIISNTPRNLPLPETSSGGIIPDLIPQLKERGGIVWVSSSRGCPWDCTFCSVSAFREMTGPKGATRREIRPVNDVINELRELYNFGIKHFVFADDEMLVGSEEDLLRWEQLAYGIKNIGNDITFQCSVRSDVIWNKKDKDKGNKRRKAFHKLVDAGLTHVYMGLESGSPTQLKRYNKNEGVETHLKTIEILREEGVLVGAGFIMFDPFMTLDEIQENIEFIKKAELISHTRKDYIGDVFDLLRVQQEAKFKEMLAKAGLLGEPIPNTLFYNYEFQDIKVKRVAETCISLAAEIDDFFESLKNSVFAKTMADEKSGGVTAETKLLNYYLIELRLLDLSLLEELVNSSKMSYQDYSSVFDPSVVKYRETRQQMIKRLYDDMRSGKIVDPDIVFVLTENIRELSDFKI